MSCNRSRDLCLCPLTLVAFLACWAPLACSDQSLEVRGSLDRIVGETVTMSLVEGENELSGEVELVAADQAPYAAAALKVDQIDNRTLSFVIPPGIATGKALAKLGQTGGPEPYEVPIHINRLALALTSTGVVELLPLPKATLKPHILEEVDATGGLLSLTASGGEVAILAQGQIDILPLGRSSSTFPGISQAGGRAMVAIPRGVLLCTDTAVLRYTVEQDEVKQTDAIISGCAAIAANPEGTKAVVLSSCDSDNDGIKEDCLTVLTLDETIVKGAQVSLDSLPTATMVGLRADGKGAVVPDSKEIYGIWFGDGGTPTVTSVTWDPLATPAGIARGSSSLGDLFAVGDSSSGRIRFVAFDSSADNTLKMVSELSLKEIPTALDFGKGANLYVAAGTKLYSVNAQIQQPTAEELTVSASSHVGQLLVQP